MGIKAHFDLLSGILFCGKVWQIVLGKIIETRGFQIFLKAAANQRAKNKNFAYTIGIYWKIVFCPILNSDDTIGGNIQTRFFFYLFDGVFTDRDIHITPAARKRPFSVVLTNKKNLPISKNGCTGVQLRGLISSFVAEQVFYGFSWDT